MDECDFVKWYKINLTNVVEMDFDDMTKCHVNLQGGHQPAKFSTTCHMSTWQIVRANSNHTASAGMYVYVLGTYRPTNPHSTLQTDGDLARLLLSSIKRTFFSISIFLLNLHILSMCYNAEVMASITLQGFKTRNQNQGFYTNILTQKDFLHACKNRTTLMFHNHYTWCPQICGKDGSSYCKTYADVELD